MNNSPFIKKQLERQERLEQIRKKQKARNKKISRPMVIDSAKMPSFTINGDNNTNIMIVNQSYSSNHQTFFDSNSEKSLSHSKSWDATYKGKIDIDNPSNSFPAHPIVKNKYFKPSYDIIALDEDIDDESDDKGPTCRCTIL